MYKYDPEKYDFEGNIKTSYDKITHISFKGESLTLMTGTCIDVVKGSVRNLTRVKILPNSVVKIYGIDIRRLRFEGSGMCNIHIERNSKQTNASKMFYMLTRLTKFTAAPNTFGEVTEFYRCWDRCKLLMTFPLIDMSKAKSLLGTWNECSDKMLVDIEKNTK